MSADATQRSARYWWIVLLAAVTFATSWLIALIAIGSWLLFDRPEPIDDLIVGFWGIVLPGWMTLNIIQGIAARRADPARSERRFLLALLASPLVAIGYASLAGWIDFP